MGPGRAAYYFKEKNPDAERYRVTLYGSLALTGVGHGTDVAIQKMINRPDDTEIIWESTKSLPHHPNGMLFESYNESGEELDTWTVYSIGGGT